MNETRANDLIAALEAAGLPSNEAYARSACCFDDDLFATGIQEAIRLDADTLLPILAAHASPVAKAKALPVLLEERLARVTPTEWRIMADAAANRSYWGARLLDNSASLDLLAPEVPDGE